MSQMPRWYRRQWYEHKLGLDSPNAGYIDQAEASAMRKAVNDQLDRDDRDFAQHQQQRTQHYSEQLKPAPTSGEEKKQ